MMESILSKTKCESLREGTTDGLWYVDGEYICASEYEPPIARVLCDEGKNQGRQQAACNAALLAAAPKLARSIEILEDRVQMLSRELARACSIFMPPAGPMPGGRTTAPTDAEIDAHAARGGMWMVRAEWRWGRQTIDFVQSWAPQIAKLCRDSANATWWMPLDATQMPCDWPSP